MIYFKMVSVQLMNIFYILASWRALTRFIHMFQLNSYKPKVQIKWIKENASGFFIGRGTAFVICLLIFIISSFRPFESLGQGLGCLISAAMLAFSFAADKPKPAKIPLKFTARIKRLLVTLGIIYLIPVVFTVLPLGWRAVLLLAAVYSALIVLAPFTVLLANLINQPIEKAINRHYINDAKRILSECKNLTVIGITGSFGKTSVKYFLDELLSVKYNVLKTPGNFNTPLGVVKTIRGELRATHDIFLCEMGAKNVGDIKEICDIVHPKHGIITAVGPMHLESFGNLENVKKTKFELADALPENGMLFLNMDDENVRDCSQGRRFIGYGIDFPGGYRCENIGVSVSGSEFEIVSPTGERCKYKTKLIGRHNVLNICGAVAAANSLGIPLEDLKPAVRRLESVPHRLELRKNGGVAIIDDAYNSNPTGAKAALDALSEMSGLRILCTPGMIELGDREFDLNRELGEYAASRCDFAVTVGKTNAEAIVSGLRSQGFSDDKIYQADSLNDAMQKIYSLPDGGVGKIILLENDLPDNY